MIVNGSFTGEMTLKLDSISPNELYIYKYRSVKPKDNDCEVALGTRKRVWCYTFRRHDGVVLRQSLTWSQHLEKCLNG